MKRLEAIEKLNNLINYSEARDYQKEELHHALGILEDLSRNKED